MIDDTFVKISRKLLKWQWIQNPQMVSLWVNMLLRANHVDSKWEGIEIKRGQLVTSTYKLSESTGISRQTIKTLLGKLKSTHEITIKSTYSYSIITICKYSDYQDKKNNTNPQINLQTNQQLTYYQPTTNLLQEYIKKENNLIEDIFSRKEKFKNEVWNFEDEFEEDHLTQFFNYWSEETHDKLKMRFEQEEYWVTRIRLQRFKPIE
jgi:hypothetical protein